MPSKRLLLLLALQGLLFGAAASSGDAAPDFRRCTAACAASGCTDAAAPAQRRCSPLCRPGGGQQQRRQSVAWPLRLWRWDCAADCAYLCMWQREEAKQLSAPSGGTPARPEKYFGKWPFTRLLGMQEPASVLFSLLNLAAQLRSLQCYLQLRRRGGGGAGGPRRGTEASHGRQAQQQVPHPGNSVSALQRDALAAWHCRPLWPVHFLLAANAWLWSAVFHARDTRLTERLDYYSAGALVAFSLFLSVVRTLRLSAHTPRRLLAAALTLAYLRHVQHMQFVRFDYGLHVRLCVGAGVAQAALWVGWAAAAAPRAHAGRAALAAFVVAIHAAMLLEVFDFPPLWRALDAHACWHLATAPLAWLWFRFLAADWAHGSRGCPGEAAVAAAAAAKHS